MYLIRWQQFSMVFIDADFCRYFASHLFAVASEHNRFLYSHLLQRGNGFCTVVLDAVIDDDMSDILAVYSNMDDSSCVVAVVPGYTQLLHQLCVSHINDFAGHDSPYAMPCNLFNVAYLAAVNCLVREGVTQCCADRVRREMLHVSSQMQQFVFVELVGMYGFNSKLAVGEGSCLVEYHCRHIGKCIHIVTTLDEYTLARGTAETTKEGKGYADDKRTRTADDKEDEGTLQPCGKGVDKRHPCECPGVAWRNDGDGQRCEDYDRRVDASKPGNK